MTGLRRTWCTPLRQGAISVVAVHGDPSLLHDLLSACCRRVPAPGDHARCSFADDLGPIDDGVVARSSLSTALLMPHGGVRIAQRLSAWLDAHGAVDGPIPSAELFPEVPPDHAPAAAMIARCTSRRGVDLLLSDAKRAHPAGAPLPMDRARARRLAALLNAPRVVLAGPTNVGKSTLTNALAGQVVSVTHDAEGTTRDPVPVALDLDGLAVDWIDLPGDLSSREGIDAAAARIALDLRAGAALTILATAPGRGWPQMPTPCAAAPAAATDTGGLTPPRVVRVLLQADRADAADCPERASAQVVCSAKDRMGLDALAVAIRRAFIPDADLDDPRPWLFEDAHQ